MHEAPLAVDIALQASALIVAIGGASVALRKAYRAWRRIDATLHAVAVEFAPNGGSTLRDSVDRIEQSLLELATRVDSIEARTPPPTTRG